MPCYDPRDHEDDLEARRRLDAATAAACDLAGLLRAKVNFSKHWKVLYNHLKPATLAWIAEHDRVDAERLRQRSEQYERLLTRQRVLNKLTPKERRLLNLA